MDCMFKMSVHTYGAERKTCKVAELAEHTSTLVGSRIYVFGGYDFEGGEAYGELSRRLRIYDHARNTCQRLNGPEGRAGHAACLADDKVFIFGGGASQAVCCFDVVAQEWLTLDLGLKFLQGRVRMSAHFLEDRKEIIVLGGQGSKGKLYEVYAVNVESSRVNKPDITGSPAVIRHNYMSVSTGKRIYFCGGDYGVEMDVYILSAFGKDRLRWSSVDLRWKIKPTPRSYASFECVDDRLILFGGRLELGEKLSEVWEFSLKNQRWKLLKLVPKFYARKRLVRSNCEPLYGHTATVFGKELLILGGYSATTNQTTIFLGPELARS